MRCSPGWPLSMPPATKTIETRESIGRSCCVFIDVEGAKGVYTQLGISTPNPRAPQEIAEFIGSYAEAGVDHLMIWLDPYTDEAIEQLAEGVRSLRG